MSDSRRRFKTLKTVPEVVEVVKPDGLKRLLGMSKQHINNVVSNGRLPYPSFVILTAELRRLGYRASPLLWGIRPRNWTPPQ